VSIRTIAFIYGAPIGVGGLGTQAGNALRALSLTGCQVHAIGPGPGPDPRARALPNVTWHSSPPAPTGRSWWRPFRRFAGVGQAWSDRRLGRFAGAVVASTRPDLCYSFTQVGLEALQWADAAGIPSILESPNGHLRAFRDVYVSEAARHCGRRFHGHPSRAMVERVDHELTLATRVRVSSNWTAESLASGGVPVERLTCLQQPVDLDRYRCKTVSKPATGPLRVCSVGSLDLRKGFVYLLQAIRSLGAHVPVSLRFVGATGDRCSRMLLERERQGLDVVVRPGDPRDALADAEVFALPTLEDGSPFAVAEAMACARAVITTTSTGAAEWVEPGTTGWLVRPASFEHLAEALAAASDARPRLGRMGELARDHTERRAGPGCDRVVADWVLAW
jgi:glycosyltransferase involved in cell wall biosynthesis